MNSQRQWRFVGSIPENYERYLVPSIFGPWAEDLVEMAALRPGERVLDIACGTGIVAVHSSSADSPISNILNRLTADGDFDKGISVRLLLKNWCTRLHGMVDQSCA
jgi:hypothetical protein